jgi:hypothetical protein
LNERIELRREDIFIVLTEVVKENGPSGTAKRNTRSSGLGLE